MDALFLAMIHTIVVLWVGSRPFKATTALDLNKEFETVQYICQDAAAPRVW
jgi:hypothetical protein